MSLKANYTVMTNPNLHIFRPFHESEWAKKMLGLAEKTKAERPVTFLLGQWFKASSAFRQPGLMMRLLKVTNEGFQNSKHILYAEVFKNLRLRFDNDFSGLSATKRKEVI